MLEAPELEGRVTLAIVLVVAYLLGSIPTSYIVVYRITGRDIRTIGTGNPGAMNVLDHVGRRVALLVGLGDILKGGAAVGIAYWAGLEHAAAISAGLAAVAGHDWSIFLRLHGGNGTATAVGAITALLPVATVLAVVVTLLVYFALHSRRLAGLIGLGAAPAIAYWLNADSALIYGSLLLIGLTVLKIIRFEGFTPASSGR